jgi:hypothetical protein
MVSAYVSAVANRIGSIIKEEKQLDSEDGDDDEAKTILESEDEDNLSQNEE